MRITDQQIQELMTQLVELKNENKWLKEQLSSLQNQLYGRKSEKTAVPEASDSAQTDLFSGEDFLVQNQKEQLGIKSKPSPIQYKRVKGKLVKIKSVSKSPSKNK